MYSKAIIAGVHENQNSNFENSSMTVRYSLGPFSCVLLFVTYSHSFHSLDYSFAIVSTVSVYFVLLCNIPVGRVSIVVQTAQYNI